MAYSWLPLQQCKDVPCYTVITSPAGAVAKYCDEHVCLSVCLSVIFGTTRDLYQILCMFPTAVDLSSGRITKSPGKGQFCGFFSSHWQCIVTRSLQITSCSNRTDHSVAVGGYGSAQSERSVIYDCLVKYCNYRILMVACCNYTVCQKRIPPDNRR